MINLKLIWILILLFFVPQNLFAETHRLSCKFEYPKAFEGIAFTVYAKKGWFGDRAEVSNCNSKDQEKFKLTDTELSMNCWAQSHQIKGGADKGLGKNFISIDFITGEVFRNFGPTTSMRGTSVAMGKCSRQ